MLAYLRSKAIPLTAYAPLAQGRAANDATLASIGRKYGAPAAQVAIAWVAAQGNDIVPLVGARRRDRLAEALGALNVKLTDAHLAALAKAFPPGAAAGERYPQAQLAHLDSEKPTAA